jgi:restriction system protein
MSGVSKDRRDEIIRGVLTLLALEPDGMRVTDVIEKLASQLNLTTYEKGNYDSDAGLGKNRFDKIVRFATVPAARIGWLLKHRGSWQITEEGKRAMSIHSTAGALYKTSATVYREYLKSRNSDDEAAEDFEEETSDVAQTVTFQTADDTAWASIERHFEVMDPYHLQSLVGDLLRAMGYYVDWESPPGKDGGVDLIAFSDPLGSKLPRIKVQVKRHKNRVAVDGLRSFAAVLDDEDVGLFVNTGGFTRDAEDEARSKVRRRVTLINLERLFELWLENYPKLSDSARMRFPIKAVHFLAPGS